jgi:hypothetical protein
MNKPEPTTIELPGNIPRAAARQLALAYCSYMRAFDHVVPAVAGYASHRQKQSALRTLAKETATLVEWQSETGIVLVDNFDAVLEAAKKVIDG